MSKPNLAILWQASCTIIIQFCLLSSFDDLKKQTFMDHKYWAYIDTYIFICYDLVFAMKWFNGYFPLAIVPE